MRASTSASQAWGSTLLSLHVWMSVNMTAARSPPRSEPANSHDLRPSAIPLSTRSAALLLRQIRPGGGADERRPGPVDTRDQAQSIIYLDHTFLPTYRRRTCDW